MAKFLILTIFKRPFKSNWCNKTYAKILEKNKLENFEKKNVFMSSKLLFLNSNKAKKTLKWNCLLTSKQTIELTSSWYKKFYSKNIKMNEVTLKQINEYESILRKKKLYESSYTSRRFGNEIIRIYQDHT